MQPILIMFSLFLNFSKFHFPIWNSPELRIYSILGEKKKVSSRKLQHLTIFETDAPGSWKQPCLNTEFQGIPVKFRRFLNFLKLKHRILEPILERFYQTSCKVNKISQRASSDQSQTITYLHNPTGHFSFGGGIYAIQHTCGKGLGHLHLFCL